MHRLAAGHRRMFGGRAIAAASPQGRFTDGARRLDGRVRSGAEAHGKHLLLSIGDDRVLHIHLGIYGSYAFAPAPALAPTGAIRLRLTTETDVADLRGPNACELQLPGEVQGLRARGRTPSPGSGRTTAASSTTSAWLKTWGRPRPRGDAVAGRHH